MCLGCLKSSVLCTSTAFSHHWLSHWCAIKAVSPAAASVLLSGHNSLKNALSWVIKGWKTEERGVQRVAGTRMCRVPIGAFCPHRGKEPFGDRGRWLTRDWLGRAPHRDEYLQQTGLCRLAVHTAGFQSCLCLTFTLCSQVSHVWTEDTPQKCILSNIKSQNTLLRHVLW